MQLVKTAEYRDQSPPPAAIYLKDSRTIVGVAGVGVAEQAPAHGRGTPGLGIVGG